MFKKGLRIFELQMRLAFLPVLEKLIFVCLIPIIAGPLLNSIRPEVAKTVVIAQINASTREIAPILLAFLISGAGLTMVYKRWIEKN